MRPSCSSTPGRHPWVGNPLFVSPLGIAPTGIVRRIDRLEQAHPKLPDAGEFLIIATGVFQVTALGPPHTSFLHFRGEIISE